MLVISGISLPFPGGEEEAFLRALKQVRVPAALVREKRMIKVSVDCRHRDDVRMVYTVGIVLKDRSAEERYLSSAPSVVQRDEQIQPLVFQKGGEKGGRPVVVGFGPGGMFAALVLAREGYRPIVLERGMDMDRRVAAVETFFGGGKLDPDTNVQFGEGGAGTFSDGKLTTRIGDSRCGYVLRELISFGAPGEIGVQAKPHIGTDLLRQVVKNIRREIISLGGEVRFETAVTAFSVTNGRLTGIQTNRGQVSAEGGVVLAIGHSARDTFEALYESGVPMTPKEFSVGVRIEHLQKNVDQALYGKLAGHPLLPTGAYQQSFRQNDRGVYTFCMCPGGFVVAASSQENTIVTNGMSNFDRGGANANSAIAVNVSPKDFGSGLFDGVRFQQDLERRAFAMGGEYRAPMQTVGNFLEGKPGGKIATVVPTYPRGTVPAAFDDLFPPVVCQYLRMGIRKFGTRQRGFDHEDAVLTGPETRTSSPLRILRDDKCRSAVEGLYPCGEGAGYAGGIMSAAVDGIRVAAALMERYAPDVGE